MPRKTILTKEMIEEDLPIIASGQSAASVFRRRGISRTTYATRVREYGLGAKWADAMQESLSGKQPSAVEGQSVGLHYGGSGGMYGTSKPSAVEGQSSGVVIADKKPDDPIVEDKKTTNSTKDTPITQTGRRRIDPPEPRGEDTGKKESKKNEKGLILGLPPVLFWVIVGGVGIAVLYFALRPKKAAQSSQPNQQQDNPEQVDPYEHLRKQYRVK